MTIGIAARGPNAGMAIYRSLRATERVGSGGFATSAVITADGKLLCHRQAQVPSALVTPQGLDGQAP